MSKPRTTKTKPLGAITASEAEAVATRIYHRDGKCVGKVKRNRTKTPLYGVGYARLDGGGTMQTGGSNVGWLEAFANAGIGPEHVAVHLRAVRNGDLLPPTDPKCPRCASRVRFDGERCFSCGFVAPDAKPWQPAPHSSGVEPSCPMCSRTNAMLSSYDWTARKTVLRCRDCDYAPNHPHVPAPWRFTRYYQGSVNNTTIVQCEPDDLRVLVAAAKHEGTMGIRRSTDAKRHGEIVVTNSRGDQLARFSRAEAYAAQALGELFFAWAQIERPAAILKMCASCASSGPTWLCRGCGAHCCEHRCGNKVGSDASCGACKRGAAALAAPKRPIEVEIVVEHEPGAREAFEEQLFEMIQPLIGTCYACDEAATGTCDRSHVYGEFGAVVPACDRHRDDRKAWHELPWSCGHDDAIRGPNYQTCAICGERRYAPGFEPYDHPVYSPAAAALADTIRAAATAAVRFEIKRKCAGRCGADITYEVIAEFSHCAPEVAPKDATVAYGGGHLCAACDMRIGDALRGGKAAHS